MGISNDDFYLKCADTAMQYSDNKLNALRLKAGYETRLTLVLAHLMNAAKPDMMKEMSPEDLYDRWMDYLNKEKEKSEKLPSIFIRQKKD